MGNLNHARNNTIFYIRRLDRLGCAKNAKKNMVIGIGGARPNLMANNGMRIIDLL
jgi:hypothetical protein